MDALNTFNRWLFLQLNADHDAHTAYIVFAVLCAEYLIILFFLVLLGYLLLRHRANPQVWAALILSLAIGAAAAYLIRKGCYHPRPFALPLGTNFLPHEWSSSFPSKHVTAIATPAFSLCWLTATRRLAWFAVVSMLLVAWSRIYLGVHWPMDIFGAFFIGLTAAWMGQAAAKKLPGKLFA
ncbi:phosphatase PAP2 family protein [Neisseria shayeganii]|uniref:Phosphatase PAP2 family protein n=1 Tax=Neisseria shayeganii TaxID=607712 RepID=A0A7D7N3D5_9NEIS|nr:phosphatase PAP2 family protein [Neisseria shayeganii]QMT40465.1 phosphatase PAP2 family protein [Neisseria shayeganii]